jgi:DedD protein
LLGAIALVMLLVVFVPMILDSEPRPARTEPSLAIPPKESVAPLPAPTTAPRTEAATPTKSPAAPANVAVAPAAKVPVTPAKAGAQAEAKAPASTTVAAAKAGAQSPAADTKTAAPKEGFAVQVGAFRDETKLAQAREKLAAAGVAHYTEVIEAKGGALTRLRAGPFPTREAAEAALAKLKRAALDGKVVPAVTTGKDD